MIDREDEGGGEEKLGGGTMSLSSVGSGSSDRKRTREASLWLWVPVK